MAGFKVDKGFEVMVDYAESTDSAQTTFEVTPSLFEQTTLEAGKEAEVLVRSLDTYGNLRRTGLDNYTLLIVPEPSGNGLAYGFMPQNLTLQYEHASITYKTRSRLTIAGLYRLYVDLDGMPISGLVDSHVEVVASHLSAKHCAIHREKAILRPLTNSSFGSNATSTTSPTRRRALQINSNATSTETSLIPDVVLEMGFFESMHAGETQSIIVHANDMYGNRRSTVTDLFILKVFDIAQSPHTGLEEVANKSLVELSSKVEVVNGLMQHRLAVTISEANSGKKSFQLQPGGIAEHIADGPYESMVRARSHNSSLPHILVVTADWRYVCT